MKQLEVKRKMVEQRVKAIKEKEKQFENRVEKCEMLLGITKSLEQQNKPQQVCLLLFRLYYNNSKSGQFRFMFTN